MRRLILAAGLVVALVAAGCGTSSEGWGNAAPLATTVPAPTTTTTTTPTPGVMETADSLTISGSTLPRFGEGPDPAVGLTAPMLAGTSFDGSEVRIAPSGRGRFTVIMFLAHWCSHCRTEVEDLGPYLATTPPPENIDLVAVSTGVDETRPNYPPSEWLTPAAWPVPVLIDTADDRAASAYGLSAFPFWVVLDGDGTVLARTASSLPLETVEALFDDLAQFEG